MVLWEAAVFDVPQPESFRVVNVGEFMSAVGYLLFIIGTVIFFVLLVWGGLEWITSGGDKAKLQAARSRLTQALVGLSIMSFTLAIVILAEQFFGIQIIGDDVPLPQAFEEPVV